MDRVDDAPIFLIGYRGTGKTTVARELASRLGCTWVDADDLIEQGAGKTIAAIFAASGEAGFREVEVQVVRELCDLRLSGNAEDGAPSPRHSPGGRGRKIVALGGGAVLRN